MQVASISTVNNAIGLLGGVEKAAAIKCAAGAGGAGGKVGMDSVSVAACNLSRANMTRMSNWAKFLVCEMTWRTMKDFEDNFGGPDEWINSAKAQVQPKCQEAAYCEKNGQTVDWLCGDGTRSRLLNECYQAQLPEYLRSRMSRYATSTPVELNR
jgi:hypothetical protein